MEPKKDVFWIIYYTGLALDLNWRWVILQTTFKACLVKGCLTLVYIQYLLLSKTLIEAPITCFRPF